MTDISHTPWRHERLEDRKNVIRNCLNDSVCTGHNSYLDERDFTAIVKAVNCHAEAIKLLQDIEERTLFMMEHYGYDRGWYDADSELEKRLKALLSKAGMK